MDATALLLVGLLAEGQQAGSSHVTAQPFTLHSQAENDSLVLPWLKLTAQSVCALENWTDLA